MLLIFGLGYTGRAIAKSAHAGGIEPYATIRDPDTAGEAGLTLVAFARAASILPRASHILISVPPGEDGDPVLQRYGAEIARAASLRWIGYLSTTGVYGNRDGGEVDEDTPAAPQSERAQRRLAAEAQWRGFGARCAVDIFRLAGIYGPGRSAFDDLRRGGVSRVIKPGHRFGRIHRDDIAMGVLAAMRNPARGVRILNFTDDMPAASADVLAEAARLLGQAPPPAIRFEDAAKTMSPMRLSFWAENRRVANAKTKAALGLSWQFPSYREGLRAILAEETAQRAPHPG